jgi:hypothetical protein
MKINHILSSASGGQTFSSIPVCDSNGDYKGRSLHKYWQVVDKNRKGLIGRISKEWPANWDYVDENWPDTSNVDQWPESAVVAHKTGWSGTDKATGITAAVNDIGIVFLPDGRHFFISVFVTDSKEDIKTNERIIADIAKAAWDSFAGSGKIR